MEVAELKMLLGMVHEQVIEIEKARLVNDALVTCLSSPTNG